MSGRDVRKHSFDCVLCNKRTKPKERTVNKNVKKYLFTNFNLAPCDTDVICKKCRHKYSLSETVKNKDKSSHDDTSLRSPPSVTLKIPSTPKSHARCFLCKKPGPRLIVINSSARTTAFVGHNVIIPAGSRCCPSHLQDGRIVSDCFTSVSTQDISFLSRSEILHLLSSLRNICLSVAEGRLCIDKLGDDECFELTGVDKATFQDLARYIEGHVGNTPSRSVSTTLAVFLMKLKTGLPNKILATIFGLSVTSLRRAITCVRKALMCSFVPHYLGLNHITRQEIIDRHTRPLAQSLFGNVQGDGDAPKFILVEVKAEMPSFMVKGLRQIATVEANSSRLVTKEMERRIVAAIDLGTCESGWAFATVDLVDKDHCLETAKDLRNQPPETKYGQKTENGAAAKHSENGSKGSDILYERKTSADKQREVDNVRLNAEGSRSTLEERLDSHSKQLSHEKEPTAMTKIYGPTSILIEPDGRTLNSFGDDAEDMYHQLSVENKHREWYFFKGFRIDESLVRTGDIDDNFQLHDWTGKSLPAKLVISLALKNLKRDCLQYIQQQTGEGRTEKIVWVLTVPLVWTDAAVDLFKESAKLAGIFKPEVVIESEAASLFCQQLLLKNTSSEKEDRKAIIVLKAGGRTVDAEVTEISANGTAFTLERKMIALRDTDNLLKDIFGAVLQGCKLNKAEEECKQLPPITVLETNIEGREFIPLDSKPNQKECIKYSSFANRFLQIKKKRLSEGNTGLNDLLVAAIDIGTTNSAWTLSLNEKEASGSSDGAKNKPVNKRLVSKKRPTVVLIQPDGKTLDCFGQEAEDKYVELTKDKSHRQWYFFKKFKTMLSSQQNITRGISLKDWTGKELSAMTVFSLIISYLREEIVKIAEDALQGEESISPLINWSIPVPTIWNDAAKQFIREAAEKGGIPGRRLKLSLDSEAASIFCKQLSIKESHKEEAALKKFKAGEKYIVISAGGGTVDITVHELLPNGSVREVEKASGGDCGGAKVDEEFETFLGDITRKEVIISFKEDYYSDYRELFEEFDNKKKHMTSKRRGKEKIEMRIPFNFFELAKKMTGSSFEDSVVQTKYKHSLVVRSGTIIMEPDIMRSFFESALRGIHEHLAVLMKKSKVANTSAIVMVGGFAESPVLQESIQAKYEHFEIIVPDKPDQAVNEGAAIFAHYPEIVTERICKYTYGFRSTHTASEYCSHPHGKSKVGRDGVRRCLDIFSIMVKIGQAVKLGEESEEQICCPVYDSQDAIQFDIYASSLKKPFFVTQAECTKIGSKSVPIPDTSLGKKRKFGISFKFGDTEIKVKVVDKPTGNGYFTLANFLGQVHTELAV